MWKYNFLCLLLFVGLQSISAQPPGTVSARIQAAAAAEEDPFEETYESRIAKSELYGIYIPKDLGEVFQQLNEKIDAASRAKFAAMTEADARHKLHFSLGRWIIHNWGFYQGSRLTKYLNDIGLYEPDDMVRFIILTYHREINHKPLQVKELIQEFQAMRQAQREQRLLEGEVIHQETRKRPIKEHEH